MRNSIKLAMVLTLLGAANGVEAREVGELIRLAAAASSGIAVRVGGSPPSLPERGTVALQPYGRTFELGSAALASNSMVAVAPSTTRRFGRSDGDVLRGAGWTIELRAALRAPTAAGNAFFGFVDLTDAKVNETHGYNVLFQARVPKSDFISAEAILTLEDGFQPGHTYRLRIAQLIHGRELVLAEEDFTVE